MLIHGQVWRCQTNENAFFPFLLDRLEYRVGVSSETPPQPQISLTRHFNTSEFLVPNYKNFTSRVHGI